MQGLEIYFIITSIAILVLVAVLVALLASLLRHLSTMVIILRSLHHELVPLMSDLRDIGVDLKDSTQELRVNMQRVSKLGRALGDIGDDVQMGRQVLKDGLDGLREGVAPLWERWLAFRARMKGHKLTGRKS